MQEKEFPQSIRITKRCVGWEERQIQTWIESQIKKSIESEGATND
ncbi:helix-turn-helix transcriptional regulator [Oleiphilus sp. HI0086]